MATLMRFDHVIDKFKQAFELDVKNTGQEVSG